MLIIYLLLLTSLLINVYYIFFYNYEHMLFKTGFLKQQPQSSKLCPSNMYPITPTYVKYENLKNKSCDTSVFNSVP